MKAPLTPALGEAVRNDYAAGVLTIKQICAKYGIGEATLYYWVRGGPRVEGKRMFPPLPGRNPRPRKTDRVKVVELLWQGMASQVRELEQRLAGTQKPAERECDTRNMAVLVKTLRELSDFDDTKLKAKKKAASNPAPEVNDDDPRDIDEFRRELARRIAALDPAATDGTAGET
jgi:hypothetical protein